MMSDISDHPDTDGPAKAPAQNFVILYSSREGSSAVVSSLNQHPDIHVPLFEELDLFWIRRFKLEVDIHAEMDKVFRTGALNWEHDYGRRGILGEATATGQELSLGFKWRWHGSWAKSADVFKRHNVAVFQLYRHDLVDLTASCYFTRIVGKDHTRGKRGHLQFKVAQMDQKERADFQKKIEDTHVPLNRFAFYAQMFWRIHQARRNYRFARYMERAGLGVHRIYYEDFNRDPKAVLQDTIVKLGLQNPMPDKTEGPFVKLSQTSAIDRVKGGQALKNSFLTRMACKLYRRYTGVPEFFTPSH